MVMGDFSEQYKKQKVALSKRHSESYPGHVDQGERETTVQHIDAEFVEWRIKQAEEKRGFSLIKDETETPEEKAFTEKMLFRARSREVKKIAAELNDTLRLLRKKYKDELNYSKENIFSHKWMLKNKGINENLERYPMLIPLLNAVFNQTRKVNKKDLEAMKAISNHTINGNPASIFVADGDFYDGLATKLGCSKISVVKHIRALINQRTGIIESVQRLPHNVNVLCDGYYVRYGDHWRKVPLMKDTKAFRAALSGFKPTQK